MVGENCCGWRTNAATTAVEGLPMRSQSRGVRASRRVSEIWIVIAVRVVGEVRIPRVTKEEQHRNHVVVGHKRKVSGA